MTKYIEIAREMLDLEPGTNLPTELENRLNQIDYLCGEAGGELQSRQVIAAEVARFRPW